jgi:hypothetical protein
MLNEQSITKTVPPPTAQQPTVFELIETAREQTLIAARIAQSVDDLDDVTFDDLEVIARNCLNAQRNLEAIRQRLAESEVAAQ